MLIAEGTPSRSHKRKTAVAFAPDAEDKHKPETLGESTKHVLPTPKKQPSPLAQQAQRPATLPRQRSESGQGSLFQPVKSTNADTGSPPKRAAKGKGKASESDAVISREAFLANEALKRQREARNFKYKGDANAPRQTRSGRVVGEAGETDVFGEDPPVDSAMDVEEDNPFLVSRQADEAMEVDEVEPTRPAARATTPPYSPSAMIQPSTAQSVDPLPDFARPVITEVLSSLTSTGIADKPKAFHDELKNDTLLGLTKLLQGTVDRGEGNSALVTGPRGAGKTRVSGVYPLHLRPAHRV